MKKQMFSFSEVPADWALCFQNECPLHENCQRWVAGSYAPKRVIVRPCIIGGGTSDKECRHYVKAEPLTLAYGFHDLFSHVRRNEYTTLFNKVIQIFGSRSAYYRCKRGERPTMPSQQEALRNLFSSYDYGDAVVFERTQQTYFFPSANS